MDSLMPRLPYFLRFGLMQLSNYHPRNRQRTCQRDSTSAGSTPQEVQDFDGTWTEEMREELREHSADILLRVATASNLKLAAEDMWNLRMDSNEL
jgi:hypothetical protein